VPDEALEVPLLAPPPVAELVPVEPLLVLPLEGLPAPVPTLVPVPVLVLAPPPEGAGGVPVPGSPSEGRLPGEASAPPLVLGSPPIAPGPPPSRLVGSPDAPPFGSSWPAPGVSGVVDEPPLIGTLPAAVGSAGLGDDIGPPADPSGPGVAPGSAAAAWELCDPDSVKGDPAAPRRAAAWCAGR
jgi:hypothetical protein